MATKTKKRKPLELEVSDFGPIARAKIELRPLTVFVGPSNTGKSYLAILIYALHKFFMGYSRTWRAGAGMYDPTDMRYGVRRMGRSPAMSKSDVGRLREWVRATVSKKQKDARAPIHVPLGIARFIWEMISVNSGDQITAMIERAFDASLQELKRHSSADSAYIVIRSESTQSTDAILIEQQLRLGESDVRLLPSESALEIDHSDAISNELTTMSLVFGELFNNEAAGDELLTYQTNVFLDAMTTDVTSKLVHPLNSRAYYLPADRTGVMHAHHVVVNSLIRSASRAGLYDEAPLGKLSGVLADFLQQLVNLNETTKHRAPSRSLADQIEKNILSGSIHNDPSVVNYPSFSYQPAGWERNLPLMNTSSMVSELAPVVLYLRHVVRPGNTLIIEEPEAHLHPGMQREFTRQIAGMIRAGIRVIITTHSEWVLEELANLVYLSSLPAEQAKKIDESAPALTPDQVGVWLFEPKKRPCGSVAREIPLDKETGTFESGYAEVSRALYNTWADIASHDQESER